VTKSDSISPDTDVDVVLTHRCYWQSIDFDIVADNAPGGLNLPAVVQFLGQQLAANDNGAAVGETSGLDADEVHVTAGGTYYIGVSNATIPVRPADRQW